MNMTTEDETVKTDPEPTAPAGEIETLRRERDEVNDRWMRLAAEFDNYRKRTERERRELSEAASIDLVRELLPVIDDLERALEAPASGNEMAQRYRRGVELIHRQLMDVLKKRGVDTLDVVGEPFDPSWHEAVAKEPADGRPDGEITAEIRRGYRIGSRLLRPAMVKVAQA
jgi:molecular chaperone GrpE